MSQICFIPLKKININSGNTRVSADLTYSQLSLPRSIQCTTYFLFCSNHLFGDVLLRCKTPTQLQGRQMAQQVPNHSGDAGTRLPPITSLSLSNWVSSCALYHPSPSMLSSPSSSINGFSPIMTVYH